MYKIVLITPGQPSSNPRLLKEALALQSAGYQVSVIYSFWVHWADESDKRLFQNNPGIQWILAGGHPEHQKMLYWYTRIKHKISRYLAQVFPSVQSFQEMAFIRTSRELEKKAVSIYADLYIAHNLGALRPVSRAAAKYRTRYAFDAEDYHRGQENPESIGNKQTVLLEDHYLPGVAGCTAASPLIASAYRKLYPSLSPIVINNVFSRKFLQPSPAPYQQKEELKLFWFSQAAGPGRGLEELIQAMGQVKGFSISCTILGACSNIFREELLKAAESCGLKNWQLRFLGPVALEQIFEIAYDHHIGMAPEITATINRQICLTNKIFTYLLAGLAIIASDTPAQKLFLEENKDIGEIYSSGDAGSLASLLQGYAGNPDKLNTHRSNARMLAKSTLNWETEQVYYLKQIAKTLQ